MKRKTVDVDGEGDWLPSLSVPTSSSLPSSSKRSRKARKQEDPDSPEPEKRAAKFKPKCPQTILQRVERVMSQRFFLIDRQRDGDELKESFSILGSTGNVYVVTIDRLPSCTCPDFLKGNHCKHILFVFLKVLQVPESSGHWYQKALLTSELAQIFSEAPLAPNFLASARVREAFANATGAASSSVSEEDNKGKKRLPSPEDDCPVCYETLHGLNEATLTFCEVCGNAIHNECFQQWAKKSQPNVTCVYCRAKWVFAGSAGLDTPSAGHSGEGYVNLGGVAGVSPIRDESTYYHGWGRRYRNAHRYC